MKSRQETPPWETSELSARSWNIEAYRNAYHKCKDLNAALKILKNMRSETKTFALYMREQVDSIKKLSLVKQQAFLKEVKGYVDGISYFIENNSDDGSDKRTIAACDRLCEQRDRLFAKLNNLRAKSKKKKGNGKRGRGEKYTREQIKEGVAIAKKEYGDGEKIKATRAWDLAAKEVGVCSGAALRRQAHEKELPTTLT